MDNELYHYGRVGMKWGQHIYGRDRSSQTSKKKTGSGIVENIRKRRVAKQKARAAEEARERAARAEREAARAEYRAARKPAKKMTTPELEERIKRLELEKKYKSLKRETSGVAKGKAFVERVLEKSGENIVTQVSTHAMGNAANKFFESIGVDIKVNPKKGQKD